MVHGWRWDKILGTWMQVRQDLNGSKTRIMKPGWISDWTWMDTRCSFWYPHEDEGETWPGWRWDANIETWIEVSCDMDGCEILISPQVSIISSHLHPGDISPLKLHRNSILFPSQCHPGLIPPYLTCIWVLVSTLYTRIIWFPSRSRNYHLASIQVTSHLHPSTDIRSSLPSRWVSPPSSSHNARYFTI